MFKKQYVTLVQGYEIENPGADIKSAKNVGKYKVSTNAIYRPDNRYFPKSAIKDVIQDKGSTHVTGCCIGCVPTDRIVLFSEEGNAIFDFDSVKQVEKARGIMGI